MPYQNDGLLPKCKLARNNAKPLRHFWQGKQGHCECGSRVRLWINKGWICKEKLREELNQNGYSLEEVNTGSAGRVSDEA